MSEAARSNSTATPHINHWEGRLFGGLMLAAFGLYGGGTAIIDNPFGVALVIANSIAVAIVGVIGFRLIRHQYPRVAASYLVARFTEALLLGGGVIVYTMADDSHADIDGYLFGMVALGLGSMPFWCIIGRGSWLSTRFALWGVAGYLVLAVGALIELVTGQEVAYYFAALGGIFEIVVGIHLVRRGFGPSPLLP